MGIEISDGEIAFAICMGIGVLIFILALIASGMDNQDKRIAAIEKKLGITREPALPSATTTITVKPKPMAPGDLTGDAPALQAKSVIKHA